MGTKTSQCEKIIKYMKEFGSITPLDAIREFGCLRLAARIADIKRMGYTISSEKASSENRYGDKVSYARYRIIKEPV